MGDEFWEAKIGKLRKASPPERRAARESDDRDAHPKRVKTGGVTAAGERIEGNVDFVKLRQVAGAAGERRKTGFG